MPDHLVAFFFGKESMPKYQFKGKAYISGAYQDRQRCDVVKFQFDASQKVEVAKLNLMGTDLKTYEPVLLDIVIRESNSHGQKVKKNKVSKKVYR